MNSIIIDSNGRHIPLKVINDSARFFANPDCNTDVHAPNFGRFLKKSSMMKLGIFMSSCLYVPGQVHRIVYYDEFRDNWITHRGPIPKEGECFTGTMTVATHNNYVIIDEFKARGVCIGLTRVTRFQEMRNISQRISNDLAKLDTLISEQECEGELYEAYRREKTLGSEHRD